MFSEQQRTDLAAPLSREHVKTRKQAGRQLSYVEGWQAIAEANRIFGFDGWASETTELRCVAEKERKVGQTNPRDGWGVSYTAKVRVTVFAGDTIVTREGVGAGHGIDVDLGLAHESAIKEAETDGRKRALMTFGNPFGLALYDKDQANVADAERSAPAPRAAPPQVDTHDHRADADDIIDQVRACTTEDDIRAVGRRTKGIYDKLPQAEQLRVVNAGQDRKSFLQAKRDAVPSDVLMAG